MTDWPFPAWWKKTWASRQSCGRSYWRILGTRGGTQGESRSTRHLPPDSYYYWHCSYWISFYSGCTDDVTSDDCLNCDDPHLHPRSQIRLMTCHCCPKVLKCNNNITTKSIYCFLIIITHNLAQLETTDLLYLVIAILNANFWHA